MKKLLFVFLLILMACTDKPQHPYTYYYWKTHLKLDATEKTALDRASAPYLYTRFFDVDKIGSKFQPIGVLTVDKTFETGKEIVPVVFITNRTFHYIKPAEIDFLAESVFNLIQKKTREYGLQPSAEIQIDCDWTAGTREDYFKFLNKLRAVSKKNVTSTLRLHQMKDQKTMGIPPVSKVYLMCYSTSSPLENPDKNSILDVDLAKNYLRHIEDYPIKTIDVALPIYSWGIVTNHFGKKRLINGLSKRDLHHENFKLTSANEAEVMQDGFYFGNYLNKGFKIKIETISDRQRQEMLEFINGKLSDYTVVYYQLDSKFVQTFKP